MRRCFALLLIAACGMPYAPDQTEPPAAAPPVAAPSATAPGTLPVRPAHLRIYTVGDSITYGGAVGDSGANSYRGYLYDALVAAGYTVDFLGTQQHGTVADNDTEGHAGWMVLDFAYEGTPTLLSRASDFLVSSGGTCDVALVLLGINDLFRLKQSASSLEQLAAVVHDIAETSPECLIIVGTLPLQTGSADVEPKRAAWNDALPALVTFEQARGAHVRLADMSALGPGDLADGVHPSPSGYRKMAEAWKAAFDR